jgi:hypothetical protein
MKITYRENIRVKATVRPTHPRHVGLGGVAGTIVSGAYEVVFAPQPLPFTVPGGLQESLYRRALEIAQILRWQEQVVSAEVTCEETVTCSHCNCRWEDATGDPAYADCFTEPGDGPGMPVCCERAQVEWRAAQTAVTS